MFDTAHPAVSQPSSTSRGFAPLGLIAPLLDALRRADYTEPTPIQQTAIPAVLAGRDLLGCAQTGTGKTAAFLLPLLQRLVASQGGQRPVPPRRNAPRVLVLTPTRELASQIGASVERYGCNLGLRHAVVFGGVGQRPQTAAIARGLHLLIATPGRLCDLIAQGVVQLDDLEAFVLDEADRMLDQGFLPAVRRILRGTPEGKQTLLFSATMPREVQAIAAQALRDPVVVKVTPVTSTPDAVSQCAYYVETQEKRALLAQLLNDDGITRAIVFTRTKHGADRLARQLANTEPRIAAIHGNKSQNARERSLEGFRSGKLRVLIATDLAARGIDVEGISHVFNYDMPHDPESYIHRIGRTARAGATGTAVSFCTSEERSRLARIERLIRRPIRVMEQDTGGERPQVRSGSSAQPPAVHSESGRAANRRRGSRARPSRQRASSARA